MLKAENLLLDNTSGEKNLINLGGNAISPYLNDGIAYGNIKAIYKDGEIYLYSIPEMSSNNGVYIGKFDDGNPAGSVLGKLTVADGYQKITITNETNKQLNVANISNSPFNGKMQTDGLDISAAAITKNTKDYAETLITSKGKLSLNGVINNGIRKTLGNPDIVEISDSKLKITANNGLDIKYQKNAYEEPIDAIFAAGLVDINVNNGEIDIAGYITDYGNINIQNNGTGNLNINSNITGRDGNIYIKNDGASATIAGSINDVVGNLDIVNNNGILTTTAEITDTKGNITITNNGKNIIQVGSSITNNDGNTTISNKGNNIVFSGTINNTNGNTTISNEKGWTHIYGAITNKGGDISITNNGTFTEIAQTITNESYETTNELNEPITKSGSIILRNENGIFRMLEDYDPTNIKYIKKFQLRYMQDKLPEHFYLPFIHNTPYKYGNLSLFAFIANIILGDRHEHKW